MAIGERDIRTPGGAVPARRTAWAARAATLWARLGADPGLGLVIAVGLWMRVLLTLWALATLALHGSGPSIEAQPGAATSAQSPVWHLVGPWERWDALWYLHIASGGYPRGGIEAAFSPLFPLLIRVVAVPLGGSIALAAWTVVTITVVAAMWAVWHLVNDVLGPAVARRTVLLMALYPASFYLISPYPEGLFIALSAGALLAARRRAWGWAGLAMTLAVLCRPQGAVLLAALAIEALMVAGPRGVGIRPILAVTVPVLALAAWFAYCRVSLGLDHGPLTALSDGWGHRAVWPWQSIADSVHSIAGGTRQEEIGNLVVAVILLALLPLMARRLPASWTVYTALVLAVSLSNEPSWTPLMSLMRYALVIVPAFAVVATWTLPRRVWWGLAIGAVGLQAWFVDVFTHHLLIG